MNNVKVEFHIEYIKAGDIFQIQFEINGYFCFFFISFYTKICLAVACLKIYNIY